MSVEPLDKVIHLWEQGEITLQQAIGKILLWLRQLDARLRQLETAQRHLDDKKS